MRVKLLVALAIASVLLIFTAGTAMAACSNPTCGSGCTCGDDCACDGTTPCCTSCGTAANTVSANTIPVTKVDGNKVADALQQQAFAATSGAAGFPVLDGVNAEAIGCGTGLTDVDSVAADQINSIDACPLNTISNCGGSCGECPECTCTETLNTIPGPVVNLACPTVNTVAVPVTLESPVIAPTFPTINLAPTATLALPQVNTKLNCFDITCNGCGCPPVDP